MSVWHRLRLGASRKNFPQQSLAGPACFTSDPQKLFFLRREVVPIRLPSYGLCKNCAPHDSFAIGNMLCMSRVRNSPTPSSPSYRFRGFSLLAPDPPAKLPKPLPISLNTRGTMTRLIIKRAQLGTETISFKFSSLPRASPCISRSCQRRTCYTLKTEIQGRDSRKSRP